MGSHATTRRHALLLMLLISIAVPLPGRAEHGPEVCSNTVCVAGSLDVSVRCGEISETVTCESPLSADARGRRIVDAPLPWSVGLSLGYAVRANGTLEIEGGSDHTRGCGFGSTRCEISEQDEVVGRWVIDIPADGCATYEIRVSATARSYPIGASSAAWFVDHAEDRHTDAAEIEICR